MLSVSAKFGRSNKTCTELRNCKRKQGVQIYITVKLASSTQYSPGSGPGPSDDLYLDATTAILSCSRTGSSELNTAPAVSTLGIVPSDGWLRARNELCL